MPDWSLLTGAPLAPMVGPFPHRPFLETWWRHRPAGDLEVVTAGGASVAVVRHGGVTRLAGEAHLTDYHSPLGPDPAPLVGRLLAEGGGVVLDSLPGEAADPLEHSLAAAGATVVRRSDEPCVVLDLVGVDPEEGWEAMLRSRDRHEVRRKRRRFAEEHPDPEVAPDGAALGRFVDLHRMGADKEGFMTDDMARFFEDLLVLPGARLDALRSAGRVVAAAFGFEDGEAHYLYNMAYDPADAAASPGIVLLDRLIAGCVAGGRRRFDFLKGAERYKRRLGGAVRPLYTLEVAA